ncbi:protocadherin gamma-B5-like [Oncorhynchus kisutch]|uniref:protocadherin gamma-B5-like n=1 Tax=Oncorhynchus kisutch TaxID=8019 RepID=UPI0012DCF124|nr:protocadherin gamma-B5-like [Oncorhynchus kisutch]
MVKAQDGGSPPLSSNATVTIFIQDQNDNTPQVLYPVQTSSSLVAEMVPRSADVGYLVTKVVAVDVDSGQNAWLSYKLQKATDRALFEVGLQNGEIRTIRQVNDKDAVKQRLTVVVEDNGQPSRSATVNVNVAVADSFPEVLSEFTDFTHDKETTDSRKSDCKFVRPCSQNVLIMDPSSTGTMQRMQSEQNILDEPDSPLEAQDGGSPPLSSNATVTIFIQDQNDNAPQVLYPVQTSNSLVAEMVPRSADVGYLVTKVVAVDVDSGQNAWLSYKLQKAMDRALFEVGLQNGEIRTVRQVTDKDAVKQRLTVVVEDNGQPSRSATVNVNVAVADSFPEVLSEFTDFTHDKDYNDNLTFYLVLALATVIAVMSVHDPDSDNNGVVDCVLTENIPFTIKSTSNGFYSLVTDSDLDRERASEYSITVTCSDEGVPSLSSSVTLTLHISDVNDNAPVFERSSYEAYIIENNTPGLSIFTVKARDADWNQNARVSYILEDSSVNGVPVSSYVSVSADSGVVHSVRSFDYEQIKNFQFRVKAQDGGSPPLSSNATVKILIQDQNDNTPQVLYPVQTSSSLVAEMVPHSADVGYLVTKVVAVDVDSGQNAWLSYKLQKATDRALFEVGLQNGEIRTIRQVTDKDAVKQRLTVVVEDNGQPSRSATVNVNVAVADSFPEVLSEFTDFTHDKEYGDHMFTYSAPHKAPAV